MRGNVKDFDLHDSRQEVTSHPCEIGLTPVDVAAIAGLQGLGMLLSYAHMRPEKLLRKLN